MVKQCNLRWFSVLFIFVLFIAAQSKVAQAKNLLMMSTPDESILQQAGDSVFPLPPGCIGSTPDEGEELPVICCISGFVYIDGEPVAGAEIEISNAQGNSVHLVTQRYPGNEERPHYQLDHLSEPPLNIQPGDLITITARYSGHERSITSYRVQAFGQQVDVVLNRNQTEDYVFDRRIWKQGSREEFSFPNDIAVDSQSNIYVVDRANARIQVFDKNGKFIRQWGKLGDFPGDFRSPYAIAIDNNDNVYVTDSELNRVQKFSVMGVLQTPMLGGMGKQNGEFITPTGIAIDSQNNVYVTDKNAFKTEYNPENGRIQKFDPNGVYQQSWRFYSPGNITIDANDNIYVIDYGRNCANCTVMIERIDNKGRLGKPWQPQTKDGNVISPQDIAVDAMNHVYLTAPRHSQVFKFDNGGNILDVWGSERPVSGQFVEPFGIWIDQEGYFYITDVGLDSFQKFDKNRTFMITRGKSSVEAFLYSGNDLAVDNQRYIYITIDSKVQKFDPDGNFVLSWGERGTSPKQFDKPLGLDIDKTGRVFVADSGNHRIQVFDTDGDLKLVRGTKGILNGQFDTPRDVAGGINGQIYVADSGNYRIQVLDSNGEYSRTWGAKGNGNGEFANLLEIDIDSSENIFTVDGNSFIDSLYNNRIQKFGKEGTPLGAWPITDLGNFAVSTIAIDSKGLVYVSDEPGNRFFILDAFGKVMGHWGIPNSVYGAPTFPQLRTVDKDDNLYLFDKSLCCQWGNPRSIYILRPMSYTHPIATISHIPSPYASLVLTDNLVVYAQGQDSDETNIITNYEWTFRRYKDGKIQLITTTTGLLNIPARTLGPGTHQLSLRVRDDEGERSKPIMLDVFVASPQQWTMLLYLVGDYKDRNQLINAYNARLGILREALNNENVRIVVQVDGPASLEPGHKDTQRYAIIPGKPPIIDSSFEDRELDMGDPETLKDFIEWGRDKYPSKYTYLVIADHAQGVRGIGWDQTPLGSSSYLTITEIVYALKEAKVHIDVLHLDGCSMGLFDVAYELRQSTDYLISSQYLGWSHFAYDVYQKAITAATSPRELAKQIVATYAKLTRERQDPKPFTLAAVDLRRADNVRANLNELSKLLTAWIEIAPDEAGKATRRSRLSELRENTQTLNSNRDLVNTPVDFYVDLRHWATNLISYSAEPPLTDDIKLRAALVITTLLGGPNQAPFIVSNQASTDYLYINKLPVNLRPPVYTTDKVRVDLSNAYGISIYYPVSPTVPPTTTLSIMAYSNSATSEVAYFDAAYDDYIHERIFEFTVATYWDEFLKSAVGEPRPGQPLAPPPDPLPVLETIEQLFLPLIRR